MASVGSLGPIRFDFGSYDLTGKWIPPGWPRPPWRSVGGGKGAPENAASAAQALSRMTKLPPDVVETILFFASNSLSRKSAGTPTLRKYVFFTWGACYAGATLDFLRAHAKPELQTPSAYQSCEPCGNYSSGFKSYTEVMFAELMLYRKHEALPARRNVYRHGLQKKWKVRHRVCRWCRRKLFK